MNKFDLTREINLVDGYTDKLSPPFGYKSSVIKKNNDYENNKVHIYGMGSLTHLEETV